MPNYKFPDNHGGIHGRFNSTGFNGPGLNADGDCHGDVSIPGDGGAITITNPYKEGGGDDDSMTEEGNSRPGTPTASDDGTISDNEGPSAADTKMEEGVAAIRGLITSHNHPRSMPQFSPEQISDMLTTLDRLYNAYAQRGIRRSTGTCSVEGTLLDLEYFDPMIERVTGSSNWGARNYPDSGYQNRFGKSIVIKPVWNRILREKSNLNEITEVFNNVYSARGVERSAIKGLKNLEEEMAIRFKIASLLPERAKSSRAQDTKDSVVSLRKNWNEAVDIWKNSRRDGMDEASSRHPNAAFDAKYKKSIAMLKLGGATDLTDDKLNIISEDFPTEY